MVVTFDHIIRYVRDSIKYDLNQAVKLYVSKYDAFYKWYVGNHSVRELIENGFPEKMNNYIERQTQLLVKAIEDYLIDHKKLDHKKAKEKLGDLKLLLNYFQNDEWQKIRVKFQELKNEEYVKTILPKKSIDESTGISKPENINVIDKISKVNDEYEDSLGNFELIDEKFLTNIILNLASEFIKDGWKIIVRLSSKSDDEYIMVIKNETEPDKSLDSFAEKLSIMLKTLARDIDVAALNADGAYFIKGSFKIS